MSVPVRLVSSIAGRSASQVEALPSPAVRMADAAMACQGGAARVARRAMEGAAIAAMRWRRAGGATGLTSSPAHDLAQGIQAAVFGGKGSIRGQTNFEIEHARGIELAVERRVGGKSFVACAHFASGLPKAAMSRPRARARRDITVPKGTPVISPMSR